MLYDETVYPNPDQFNPDRFLKNGALNPDIRDPRDITFGFGRSSACSLPVPNLVHTPANSYPYRICPGRHMAYASLWIAITSILSVFKIEKTDETVIPERWLSSALLA